MRTPHPVLAISLVLPAVSACTVGPNFHAPTAAAPDRYNAPPADARSADQGPPRPPAPPVELATWWRSFDDPLLNDLIERAVAGSLDLRIAAARLGGARSELTAISGTEYPSVDVAAAAARGSGTNSTKGRIPGPLNAGSNTTGLHEITHIVGFDAMWELDLFGRVRREVESARADEQSAEDLRNQVLVTLVGDVARAYMHARAVQLRLEIAHRMVDAASRTADLTRAKLQRGLVNELDAVLAERQLATVRARIQPLEADLAAAKRSVAILVGDYTVQDMLDSPSPVPTDLPPISAGLPGDLLARRPDVRAAQDQLASANARIGVAEAALYPQVTLSGGVGYQAQGLGRTPVEWSPAWSAGGAVRWQILDFGAISSLVDAQDYRTQALLVAYERTVMGAVREVEDALTYYSAEGDRLAQLNVAFNAAQRAVTLATQRYDRGLIDFLNVLDAQRQLFDVEDQRALSTEASATQFIAVCKALGGGWEGREVPTPAPDATRALSRATAESGS